MYILIKFTQINERTYISPLFIFAITEFSHLSMFIKCFHFYKTHVTFHDFFFFEAKNINFLMLKRTHDLLKDWNIIWNKKFREC